MPSADTTWELIFFSTETLLQNDQKPADALHGGRDADDGVALARRRAVVVLQNRR